MRLWIDLANSPHVPFFKALAARFVERGHEIEITARDFAETVPLAKAAGFAPQVVGAHGVFNMSASDPDGHDERARVLVRIEKGDWKLIGDGK